MAITRTIKIQNLKGLHARATAAFVKTAELFQSDVTVEKEGEIPVSGKSIMGLLMLAVPLGEDITISVSGPDEEKAMQALCDLVNDRFGEGV